MKKTLLTAMCITSALSLGAQTPAYKDAGRPVEERVADLVGRMTLHEKVLQLNQYTLGRNDNANNIGTTNSKIPLEIGSILYTAGDPQMRNDLQRKVMEESRLGIPVIFGYDVIHGYRTVYPIPLAQACSFNPTFARDLGRVAAREAVLSGLDWTFSPMIDVSRDGRWGRVAECYGEDPFLNAAFGVAAVKGFQGDDLSDKWSIAACLKHYVGYGVSEGGRDYRYTDISRQALWETYMVPYKACVEAGAATLMSAFNDISGVPATSNHYTLTEVLKEKWHHDGFVVSDWDAINQLIAQGVAEDARDAAAKAFLAGVEMDMVDDLYGKYLESLVEDGTVPMSLIDEAVSRVLRVKFRLGLFEHPYVDVLPEGERYLRAADKEAVARFAEETIVLLKNEAGILPLSKSLKKVAVIGPLAKDSGDLLGSWSAAGRAEDVTSIYDALVEEFASMEFTYAEGCSLRNDAGTEGFAQAAAVAADADVVLLCLGESRRWSGENASRSTISLPAVQEQLFDAVLAAGKPVVLLLSNGRPLDLSRLEPRASAVVELWQPGIAGGCPVAGVLSGRVNPSGKLSITFPLSSGQIPVYYNMRNPARAGTQGNYQDIPTEPLHWFGYGLSYTEFTYSDARLSKDIIHRGEKVTAEVKVTNSGAVDGKEAVLWYVKDPASSITRPMKELRHFDKKLIKAGETVTFTFEIDPQRDLSYVDANGDPLLEAGKFFIIVGGEKLPLTLVD